MNNIIVYLFFKAQLLVKRALSPAHRITAIIQTKLFSSYYKNYKEIQGLIDAKLKNRVCLFSHFDKNNRIEEYVIFYLKALQENDCAIFFITTSQNIDQKYIDLIKPYIVSVLVRPNCGLDFGSFCTGMKKVREYPHFQQLIFANDSVYGPISPLKNVFDAMKAKKADVFGITDSWQVAYHLQSYFLIFNRTVFTGSVFTEFFNNFKFSYNKHLIISEYEVGLSKLLIKNDYKVEVLCNSFEVARAFSSKNQQYSAIINKLQSINSTHYFWKILIEYFS
jgi:rhamnosyltransferase